MQKSSLKALFCFLAVAQLTLALDVRAASSRGALDTSKPEIVSATGIDEEDAIRKALRSAVSQRCGENLRSTTVESNTYNRSRAADQDANIVGSDSVDVRKRSQLAATTGGVIRKYQVMASGSDGENRYSVTVEVFIEKCLVEETGRISVRSPRKEPSTIQSRIKVDPKAAVERNVSVIIRFDPLPAPVDSNSVQELISAIAKSFAVNIAKSNILQKSYRDASRTTVRNNVTVYDFNFQPGTAQLSATVTLYGVNAEIDGTTLGAEFSADSSTTLDLLAGYNEKIGFSYFKNKKDNNLIVVHTDKTGAAFGKLVRGDVIETINSVSVDAVENIDEKLSLLIKSGPVKMSIKRGPVTTLVVLR
jgi:hypothetical protein